MVLGMSLIATFAIILIELSPVGNVGGDESPATALLVASELFRLSFRTPVSTSSPGRTSLMEEGDSSIAPEATDDLVDAGIERTIEGVVIGPFFKRKILL